MRAAAVRTGPPGPLSPEGILQGATAPVSMRRDERAEPCPPRMS